MRWLAILALMATGPAWAVDYEALWRNTDPAQTAAWFRLCAASGCSRAVAVSCAPGAECRTRFVDPPAERVVFVAASIDGTTWSLPSNAIATDACLLSTSCRLDVDRSGTITVLDFAELLKLIGKPSR